MQLIQLVDNKTKKEYLIVVRDNISGMELEDFLIANGIYSLAIQITHSIRLFDFDLDVHEGDIYVIKSR